METREQVYDREISPLIEKIIETCKAHRIPMVMDFSLACDEDDTLKCTTAIFGEGYELRPEMIEAYRALMGRSSRGVLMVTAKKADGTTEHTAIL